MPTATTSPTTVSNITRDAHLTCGKCEGKGRLAWASHYANGVCFWCKGTGKVLIQDHNALRALVSSLRYSVAIVLEAANRGDDVRRDAYLAGMVPDMLKIGTVEAKGILNELRLGRFYDDQIDTWVQVDPQAAGAAMLRLIELGRAARAAEGVAA